MGSVINSSVSARMTSSATSLGSSQGAGGGDFGDNTDRFVGEKTILVTECSSSV